MNPYGTKEEESLSIMGIPWLLEVRVERAACQCCVCVCFYVCMCMCVHVCV